MALKKYKTVIEHFSESSTLRGGARLTLIKLENKSGRLKQLSYRTTVLGTRLVIKADEDDEIRFPNGTTIITNHVMTSSYSPECFFAHKSAASPYGLTTTYVVEFEKSIEIILVNESTTDATISEVWGMFQIFTDEYEREKVWVD